jgi:PPOX class probable F420-dependent enzyme
MSLGDEKYMLFTTFRRDGTPVATPVWVVGLDTDRVGFMTSSRTGKAKRLAHTARVLVQPCNARGAVKPGSMPIEATARLVTGDEMGDIRSRVLDKYSRAIKVMGVVRRAARLAGRPLPDNDRGVVVMLTSAH